MAEGERKWSDCLITTRIASGCKACGAESSEEAPTHVWGNVFYCGRCCKFCNPPLKEWAAPAPVNGEQTKLF